MGNNSIPKFIFRLSRFPVYRGSILGRFYCNRIEYIMGFSPEGPDSLRPFTSRPLVPLILTVLSRGEKKHPYPSLTALIKARGLDGFS